MLRGDRMSKVLIPAEQFRARVGIGETTEWRMRRDGTAPSWCRIGKRVMYADRCLGTQRISLDIRLGEPLFLHSTATGKLFAAFDARLGAQALAGALPKMTPTTITDPKELEREFKRIRSAGFARSAEESVEGIVGYAVPIMDATGTIAAAIHASVLGKRATRAHERKLLGAARDCAQQVARQLGNFADGGATRAAK